MFSHDWSTWTNWSERDRRHQLTSYRLRACIKSMVICMEFRGIGWTILSVQNGNWRYHTLHAITLGPMSKSRTNLIANAKPFVFSFPCRPLGSGTELCASYHRNCRGYCRYVVDAFDWDPYPNFAGKVKLYLKCNGALMFNRHHLAGPFDFLIGHG